MRKDGTDQMTLEIPISLPIETVSPRKMKCITIVNVLEPLDFLVKKIMLKLVSAMKNKHTGSCKSN